MFLSGKYVFSFLPNDFGTGVDEENSAQPLTVACEVVLCLPLHQ